MHICLIGLLVLLAAGSGMLVVFLTDVFNEHRAEINFFTSPLFLSVLLPDSYHQFHQVQRARALFTGWARENGKLYRDANEEHIRFSYFQSSLEEIAKHNANPKRTFDMGLTEFADMSNEEFLARFRSNITSCYEQTSKKAQQLRDGAIDKDSFPTARDWREHKSGGGSGAITPVKNQGKCGSCWAFASIGAVEAHHKIYTGERVLLSEQQLVDCSSAYGNQGCNGGWPASAMQYIKENGGVALARDYAYTGTDNGGCQDHKRLARKTIKVGYVYNVTQNDELDLQRSLGVFGPVTVAFKVNPDLRLYKSGVYSSTEDCQDLTPLDLTHAVLAVGYGTSAKGKQFYILKNSWGTNWGDQGYFLMERGVNMCGIAVCASFPVLYH